MLHSSIKLEVCPSCGAHWENYKEISFNTNDRYKSPDQDTESHTRFHCGGKIIFKNARPHVYKSGRSNDSQIWDPVCPKMLEVKL